MKSKGFFINSLKGIKIMFEANPAMFLLHIFFTTVHGASWALQVLFMQKFFDMAQNYAANKIDFRTIILYLIGMGLSYALCQLMNGVDNCHARILDINVGKRTNRLIHKSIDRINVVEFEDTSRLDFINKAITGSRNMVWVCLTLLDLVFFYTIYFSFMGWYLFTLKPILGISIVIVFIPCVLSQLVQVMNFKKLEDKSAPIRREYENYERCMTDKEFFKETRLLGATDFFNMLYTSSLNKLNRLVFIAQLKKNLLNLILAMVTVIGYGIIIYMLFRFVMNQEISIGAFAAVLASIYRLYSFMSELVSERIGWASENVATVENFLNFISEKNNPEKQMPRPQNYDIKLNNVSFIYPMTDKKALDNISLTIHNGQTLAIVGENGSGKSTLCRLIMGLYEASEGEVTFGDIPVKYLSYDNTSAVFQKYGQYKMTVQENLIISQMDKPANEAMLMDICDKSGVLLKGESYKDGLNTMLGRDFDGIEISGGQWQRIAIARGLFRHSDLIILDEPTAAIDPLEETRLYNDFINICNDKTAILVTHRLGSAKIADRIIVLKNGEIVQDGNHRQLINTDGEYKNMYESQRKWYSD
ncbi:putative multidrug resistance ABC transporter ATP-binding/permease protein YheI [compost metagenome]